MSKSRNWCFTINNWTEEDLARCKSVGQAENVKYMIVGKERAKSGTMHLQGYVKFKSPRALAGIKKLLGDKTHLESQKGTDSQARNYCTKENDYWESCEFEANRPGRRNDLTRIKKLMLEGNKGLSEIVQEEEIQNFQSLRFAEGLAKYQKNTNLREDLEVTWIYGPTGTGKTYTAFKWFEGDCWISAKNLRWWEGYHGQENILIDDFRKDFCTYHELLRILDIYPYQVEFKGGSTPLKAKRIIITSCYHPIDVYETRKDIEQLLRRITDIYHSKTWESDKDIVRKMRNTGTGTEVGG